MAENKNQNTTQAKTTNNQNKKDAAKSGLHKAAPIILTSLAAFLTLCFITSEGGLIGGFVTKILMGLFGNGAFAIPVALLLHAICYKGDVTSNKVKSRAIFSAVSVAMIAAIDYAICYWSKEATFAPMDCFNAMMGGGFIGNIIGYALSLIIGNVGVIVASVAVIAVYALFYYAEKAGSIGQSAIKVKESVKEISTGIKTKSAEAKEKKRQIKEDAAQLQREAATEELAKDEFFTAKNSDSTVKIKKLGIDEESAPNGTSPLIDRKKHPIVEEPVKQEEKPERKRRSSEKPLDLSYGISESKLFNKPESQKDKPYTKAFFGLDDSADNVFTKDFDPFDFATSEKAAAKFASKVSDNSAVQEELDEFAIYEMKANHIPTEREKKLADLERRRQEWFHYKHKKEIANNPALAAEEAAKEEAARLNVSARPLFDSVSDPALKATNAVYSQDDAPAPFHKPTVSRAQNTYRSPAATAPSTPAYSTQSAGYSAQTPSYSTPTSTYNTPAANYSATPENIAPKETIQQATASAPAESQPAERSESINTYSSYTNARASYQRPIKTVEFTITKEPKVTPAPQPEPKVEPAVKASENTEDVAILIAQKIAKNNPAYLRSANEMKTFTKVSSSSEDDELFRQLGGVIETNTASAAEVEATEATEATATESVSYEENAVEFNEEKTPEPVEFSFGEPENKVYEPTAETSYRRAAEFASSMVSGTPEVSFKPYAPERNIAPEQSIAAESSIKAERTMLPPTPEALSFKSEETEEVKEEISVPLFSAVNSAEESKIDSELQWSTDETDDLPASEKDDEEIIDFDDEDEEEDEDVSSDEIPEEETDDAVEIPPEEQNPDVIKMREMFPFLKSIDMNKPTSQPESQKKAEEKADIPEVKEEEEPVNEEEADEIDDVPFFEPVVRKTAAKESAKSTSLVPAEPKKAETKKNDYSNYVFPSLDLLTKEESLYDDNIQAEIQENADKLIETLASFNVTASIKGVDRGPRITRYEVVPAKGVKVSQIMNLQDDIALNLAAGSIRMEAPIPGKSAVGIEIPNKRSNIVRLRDLLETEDFQGSRSKTCVCIGRDVAGQPVFGDIAKMPHLLIAGATGMGKSVCINSLLISVLYKARPDEVKLIMIDPKQVEFTMYNGIPHLLVPVVSDPKQAAGSLMWAVEEMERRYNLLNPLCVRNIDAYNEKVTADPSLGQPMPRIIIVIDEFADLMLQVKDPVETLVMRIAQKARAAGIYLVIGTQRPSVNVITGVIKANVPSRISCKVMSNVDSKTVLDSAGAEKLLDRGDALYAPAGSPKPHRVQCAFVSDGEVESIMNYLKQFSDGTNYDSTVMEEIERAAQKCSKKGGGNNDYDESDTDADSSGEGYLNNRQFLDAVEVAVNTRKISTSLIQRKLSIGYGYRHHGGYGHCWRGKRTETQRGSAHPR